MNLFADSFRRAVRCATVLGMFLALVSCIAYESEPAAEGDRDTVHLGADFGNAVSHNAARHVVDPAPPNALAGAPAMDGARAEGAIRRYRGGSVIQPEAVETSNFGDIR